MSEDLTVLLVGDGEPDEKLIEQLEKKDLVVEISGRKEFPSLLALVEPHLVVLVGSEGAEEAARILKETEEVRRVRLIVLAARDDLVDLRKLDRSVVVSLLASDIAPSVIAARVLMLAGKGPEKSIRPARPSSLAKVLATQKQDAPVPPVQKEAPPPPDLGKPKADLPGPGLPSTSHAIPRMSAKAPGVPPVGVKPPAPQVSAKPALPQAKPPVLPQLSVKPAVLPQAGAKPPAAPPASSKGPALPPAAEKASPLVATPIAPQIHEKKPLVAPRPPGSIPQGPPRATAAKATAATEMATIRPVDMEVKAPASANPAKPFASATEMATLRPADMEVKAPLLVHPPAPSSLETPGGPEVPFIGEMDQLSDERTVVFEAPLPLAALAAPSPKVLVADSDTTRADMIACALREHGVESRIAPLDVAATHWNLVRAFRPTILLGDTVLLKSKGQVWLELFQADQELRRAKLVSVPFERLFNVHDGVVNIRTLIPQIPQLSGDRPSDAQPTRGPQLPAPIAAAPVKPSPSPQVSALRSMDPDEDDDEFERRTVSHPNDFSMPSEARSSSPPPMPTTATASGDILTDKSRRASVSDIEALDLLDSLPPSHPSAQGRAGTDLRTAPTLVEPESQSGSSVSTPAPEEQKKRSGTVTRALVAALVLSATGAGTWLAMGKSIGGISLPSMHHPKKAQGPVKAALPQQNKANAAPPAAPKGTEKAPSQEPEEPSDPLWVVPSRTPVPTCEELVTNLEELKVGGVQQASLSWNRARETMVLGDINKAHTMMCEAVLIHPESLALEGLASLLLTKRAAKMALPWVELAQKVRPDRSKTLEVVGDIKSQLGDVEGARKAFAAALKVPPEDQRTLDQVALQYVDDGNRNLRGGAVDQAELFYRRAATVSPTNAEATAGMAAVYAAAGTAEGAQMWAEKTLALDDSHPVALVVQAALAAEGGDTDRAIELCKRALKRDPVYAPAHQLLKNLEEQ